MNVITRSLLAPEDGEWSTIHRKLGCHGCRFAHRNKLDYDFCCSHSEGMLVNLSMKCLNREKRLRQMFTNTRQMYAFQR